MSKKIMRKRQSIDQEQALWWLLCVAKDEMNRARQRELQRYRTTIMQSTVLSAIKAIGKKVTPTDISQRLVRKPHSVSELLSRMEKEGLLRRVKDLENKSQVRVTLTEKGNKTYYQSKKRESIHEIMSCLSDEEREQLGSYLLKLREKAHTVEGELSRKLRSKYEVTLAPSE